MRLSAGQWAGLRFCLAHPQSSQTRLILTRITRHGGDYLKAFSTRQKAGPLNPLPRIHLFALC